VAAEEAKMTGEDVVIERINGDQQAGSELADDASEEREREGEEPHDLTDEIDVEIEQFEKEDESEGEIDNVVDKRGFDRE
jgi:hypothetical protein